MKAWPKLVLAAWCLGCLGGLVRADGPTGDAPTGDGPTGDGSSKGPTAVLVEAGPGLPAGVPLEDLEAPESPAASGGAAGPADAALPAGPPPSRQQPASPDAMRSVLVPPPEAASPDRQQPAAGGRPSSVAADLVERVLAGREPSRTRDARLEAAFVAIGATRPLPIVDALERAGDRSRRQWVVGAYWKAAAAVMRLAWSAEAADHVDTIPPGADPLDRAALDVAAAASLAEVSSATAAAIQACQELADVTRLSIGEPLPLPADRPLAVPYQTHFGAIFAQRLATGRIRAVDRMLPQVHEALESTGAGVLASMTALSMAEQAHARGDRGIEAVVHGIESQARERQRFLAALLQYNTLIAEYVGAVADVGVDDARFAAMLIGTPLASSWNQLSVSGQEPLGAGPPTPSTGQPVLPPNAQVILP